MNALIHRILQIAVLLTAVLIALQFLPEKTQSVDVENKFDMLGYLDDQIASQECVKDVRCWSSVSKFQMFAAGAPIDHDALGARIECYNDLLDLIWQDAASISSDEISQTELVQVLEKRFPGAGPSWEHFGFQDNEEPELIMNDLFSDYSDTIESWRIIQSWVARQADTAGKVNFKPTYSQEALDEFQRFLVKFDIAILRHSKDVAKRNKKSGIDADSMRTAFEEAATSES